MLLPGDAVVFAVVVALLLLVLANYSDRANVFNRYTYFDNNGTTQPHSRVTRAMCRAANLGNPSSAYASQARDIIASAKQLVASRVGGDVTIIFNSGASEGNNHVFRSFALGRASPHFVVSSTEHITSIECAKSLARYSGASVTFVKPTPEGVTDPADVAAAISPDTVLVSVMHINNETGAKNDVAKIGEICEDRGVPLHVDAVQSFGKYRFPMRQWRVNFATISFHKLGGPAGCGALVTDSRFPLHPLICGTQNGSMRGGTENVMGIAGALEAMRIAFKNRDAKNAKMREIKDYVAASLASEFPVMRFSEFSGESDDNIVEADPENPVGIVFIGPTLSASGMPDPARTAPNTLMVSVLKRSEFSKHFCNNKLQEYMKSRGVIVSIGSACSAGKQGSSHVLTEMQAPFLVRCGVIRVSVGDRNTAKDAEKLVRVMVDGIKAQLEKKE
jgi:cysteine desulfurase